MYSLYLRFWYMLTGWGSVGLVYSLTSSQDQASAIMLQPSFIDQWFAFDPNAIWLYLSFFPYVTLAYLFCQNQKLVWLARSMQFSAIGAGIIFILWPTTMEFPSITHDTISTAALKMLIAVDSMQNCLPSLHVTLTLLSLYAFWDRTHLLRSAFLALWAVAITVSILQLHRHQFIDAISGTALAISAGLLAHYILKLNKKIL
ncbi:hypothetical protein [Paenochrobactrum pullorum]|uniref:hypothetical protein n=1 Tax=Paenochrobactrum pullorum TaxID=1324351 RepID=UPI0035BBF41C